MTNEMLVYGGITNEAMLNIFNECTRIKRQQENWKIVLQSLSTKRKLGLKIMYKINDDSTAQTELHRLEYN